jgi:hypothetical protein
LLFIDRPEAYADFLESDILVKNGEGTRVIPGKAKCKIQLFTQEKTADLKKIMNSDVDQVLYIDVLDVNQELKKDELYTSDILFGESENHGTKGGENIEQAIQNILRCSENLKSVAKKGNKTEYMQALRNHIDAKFDEDIQKGDKLLIIFNVAEGNMPETVRIQHTYKKGSESVLYWDGLLAKTVILKCLIGSKAFDKNLKAALLDDKKPCDKKIQKYTKSFCKKCTALLCCC